MISLGYCVKLVCKLIIYIYMIIYVLVYMFVMLRGDFVNRGFVLVFLG